MLSCFDLLFERHSHGMESIYMCKSIINKYFKNSFFNAHVAFMESKGWQGEDTEYYSHNISRANLSYTACSHLELG